MDFKNIINKFYGLYGQKVDFLTIHNYFKNVKPIEIPIFKNKIPSFLNINDTVLSFYDGKNIKIYPIKIMNKRKIVHDILYDNNKKIQISITFSPLTNSPVVYKGLWGICGLIYNGNDVFYNINTGDLLVQALGIIVHGKNKGKKVKRWPMIICPINNIYNKNTLVLQKEINDENNYNTDFILNDKIDYPLNRISNKYKKNEIVYIITNNKKKKNTIIVISNKNKNNSKIKFSYDDNIKGFIFDKDSFIIPIFWYAGYSIFNNADIINLSI